MSRESLNVKMDNGEWIDIYGYKLNNTSNLADLTDKQAARDNLELDKFYINKYNATNGLETDIIHHSLIIQDPSARFVSDNQIKFWNAKLNPPMSGKANYSGDNLETIIPHNIVDMDGNAKTPYTCIAMPDDNPQGYLGEVWVRWDDVNIYVGNTGTYTGTFTWTAFY